MKTIYKKLLYILSLTLFMLVSCDKYLDLAPEDTLVESEVFKNAATVESSLGEAYFTFFQASTASIAYTIGDFTTMNVDYDSYYDFYVNGNVAPTDDGVKNIWAKFYAGINIDNNLIVKIPLLAKYDESIMKQHIAEAKFLRAFSYFNLLKLYGDGSLTGNDSGLGLPLQLTPFEGYNTGDIIPRSTNLEIYNQILRDLDEAIPDLPVAYANNLATRSRATKGSAWALRSRIYLYLGRYQEAADAAGEVLALTQVYSLTQNLLELFPASDGSSIIPMSQEYIMGFPVSNNIGDYSNGSNNLSFSYYYKRTFWINPDFILEFEPGDNRVDQLMFPGYTSSGIPEQDARITTFKFNNLNSRDNVPVIRLAEVMLTRAEALARISGVNQESVDLLNDIRERSVPAATDYVQGDFSSGDELVARILKERRFELAFEGLYRYDLIRTGQALRNPALPEENYCLPIPQVEVDISKGVIEQNPAYLSR